jgi:hypothetical protein
MKTINYILIFILTGLLTVACGGGGNSVVAISPTDVSAIELPIKNISSSLLVAFIPVAL